MIPKIISADDHVIEPAHVWQDRMPSKHKELAPKIIIAPQGEMTLNDGVWLETPGTGDKMAAWWHFENKRYQIKQMVACPGIPPEEVTMEGVTYDDIAPGCYDPIARLADMDINHVEASLCFPNYPRFCGQLFSEADDLELGLLCVQAYNDWMIDEWCGSSGGRLIPLCIVPLWDAELAAKEIYRLAEKGCRAVAWSELPAWLGRPGLHGDFWDPFLKACEETQTVICMHIGSGTKTVQTSPEAPTVVTANLIVCNSAASMIDWIFSGKFEQFPNLKLLYAESQIGWIPYFIERADDTWRTHQWAQGEKRIPKPPSHYYKKHVYSCFFKDTVGIDLLDRIGEDNVLFETDYPHQDGTFPNTLAIAEELFGHLEQETIDKIARNNAIKLFGLTI
ncbi:MAG: amidohydrolase family protein [Actinomycetota bacterium]|nr:amidohydrolase family protein [Actinomycetota bacterium]MEC7578170.1 amidohydrolase family protein [Actinomycetota bacterium]MEC7608460.1 amidohydrolase family protein [Actinomycetota bacterium]MEC8118800.1 amidohydrolase family protein [Actinomycetota bacterium]MEE3016418.1 amidohydrolase family protein [Actinomycetota bacterium]